MKNCNIFLTTLDWMELVARKIVTNQNANIILMDYADLSNCNYIYLAKRVAYDLGVYLAKSINQWRLNLNETRIIAHSLGAHIGIVSNFTIFTTLYTTMKFKSVFVLKNVLAGIAGAHLMQINGEKLARIDGVTHTIYDFSYIYVQID